MINRKKALNKSTPPYFYFEANLGFAILFDSLFDLPMEYGSRPVVQKYITKLPRETIVFYYDRKSALSENGSYVFRAKYEGIAPALANEKTQAVEKPNKPEAEK